MSELLSTAEAARRLGISRACLYDWLSQSDSGRFVVRGQPVTIERLQGGPKGQGRIKIEAREIERLVDLMRVWPRSAPTRQMPVSQANFPGITAKLGRPKE